jgi:hypothetical protein
VPHINISIQCHGAEPSIVLLLCTTHAIFIQSSTLQPSSLCVPLEQLLLGTCTLVVVC